MMLRYALRTVRARKAGFLGAFLALMCAAALISACGTLLDTGLRGTIRTERYAAAPVVVSADQSVHRITVKHRHGKTKVKDKAKPIAERAWLSEELGDRIARAPGVARVVPELTFLAQPSTRAGTGGRTAYGHAWDSAALTPYRLDAGRAPRAADELVVDADLAGRARLRPGDRLTVQSTSAPRSYRITGIATPATAVRHQTALFFSAAEARRLAAHPGQVTAFGVLPAAGADPERVRQAVARALHGTTAQVSAGDARGPVEFLDAPLPLDRWGVTVPPAQADEVLAAMFEAGAGEVGWPGWCSGHSGTRSAGGLMTAQMANDIVRDHRNSPVLLVMLSWPYSAEKTST